MSVRWRILYHVDVKKVRFWQPAFYGHMVINEDAIFIDGEATHRIGLYDLVELSTEMVPTARMIKIVSREHTFHVLPCLAHIGRTVNFALSHRKLFKALKQFAAKGESLGVMTTIEPIKTREPFFDGWETDKVRYTYSCRSCGTEMTIGFGDIHHAAWGWRERTERGLRSSLATHFGIDLSNTYIGDGRDAVVGSKCPKCSRTTFIYFSFHEYRHSCYQISLRGLSFNDTQP